MSPELYVSNLAVEVTEPELEKLFARAGNCNSATLITDRETGHSRGLALVAMESSADAEKARQKLEGYELRGRALRVELVIQCGEPHENRRNSTRRAGRGSS